MKTIKQISDEIGVSKQRVYRFIKSQKIKSAQNIASTMYFDDATEAFVKAQFRQCDAGGSTSDVNQSEANDIGVLELVSVLKAELEIKNQQISELTKALLEAQQATSAAQALHAGAIKNLTVDDAGVRYDDVVKQGLFSRIFGRNKNKYG